MKKNITLFIIFFLLVFSNSSFVFSNSGIQTTNYLIKYIATKEIDLNKIINKYDLKNDNKTIEYLKNYHDLKKFLIKLKSAKISKNNKKYINNIVKKLKSLNEEIKYYLKQQILSNKKSAKKYSILYMKKLNPIIKKINNIITQIALKLIQKERYSKKDKQIINILYLIKNNLNKLKDISNKDFISKKRLNNYIIVNFSQIKNYFKEIKEITKQ